MPDENEPVKYVSTDVPIPYGKTGDITHLGAGQPGAGRIGTTNRGGGKIIPPKSGTGVVKPKDKK